MSDYPKEVIEKIKEIDLLTYLENYEPYELVKINERMYSTREHDSLPTMFTVNISEVTMRERRPPLLTYMRNF